MLLNLLVCVAEEVIRRLRGKLALILGPDLIGLSEHGFLSGLLGSQLYRRDGALLTFLGGLFLFLDLLFQSCVALFKVVMGTIVLFLALLQFFSPIISLLC